VRRAEGAELTFRRHDDIEQAVFQGKPILDMDACLNDGATLTYVVHRFVGQVIFMGNNVKRVRRGFRIVCNC
jgi:hypothetical protein